MMYKFWQHNLFSRSHKAGLEAARALADGGDREAQFGLGLKYSMGEGDLRDLVQAAEWYRKAAEQSHSLAQFNLGMMYAAGQGVAQDGGQALLWFGRAADQGDAGAQFYLGRSHQNTSFAIPPQDAAEARIEAYKWFCLAAAQGYRGSVDACDRANLAMTHDERTEGNRRVAALVAAKPKAATHDTPVVKPV